MRRQRRVRLGAPRFKILRAGPAAVPAIAVVTASAASTSPCAANAVAPPSHRSRPRPNRSAVLRRARRYRSMRDDRGTSRRRSSRARVTRAARTPPEAPGPRRARRVLRRRRCAMGLRDRAFRCSFGRFALHAITSGTRSIAVASGVVKFSAAGGTPNRIPNRRRGRTRRSRRRFRVRPGCGRAARRCALPQSSARWREPGRGLGRETGCT